ncbi:Glutamate Receptor Ionotropic, Nmda 1 [Manis pentadactyla]|nr:Glutamate Receptor Ionotropic, Nmda 1 [Manis pentadactyla]
MVATGCYRGSNVLQGDRMAAMRGTVKLQPLIPDLATVIKLLPLGAEPYSSGKETNEKASLLYTYSCYLWVCDRVIFCIIHGKLQPLNVQTNRKR